MSDTTPPAVSDAMREAVAQQIRQHACVDILEMAVDGVDQAADAVLAGPLASEIARLTGENEAEAAVLTAECNVYRSLAEKYAVRADAAEADLTRMRAETERLRAALEDAADALGWAASALREDSNDAAAGVTFSAAKNARAASEIQRNNPEQTVNILPGG